MSTLEFTVLDLDFPVGSMKARSSPRCSSATAADCAALTDALIKRCPRPRHADRRPDRRQGRQNTGFAVSAPAVPAEAVRRPYAGNIPARTQKGLPK